MTPSSQEKQSPAIPGRFTTDTVTGNFGTEMYPRVMVVANGKACINHNILNTSTGQWTAAVAVINTATNSFIKDISLGPNAGVSDMLVYDDKVYVSTKGGNTLTVIGQESDSIVDSVNVGDPNQMLLFERH